MEREEALQGLLQQLYSGQNIEQVQEEIKEFKQEPDAALIFSNVILQTTDPKIEKAAATIYLTYIREMYAEIPPEIQEELGNELIEIFKKVKNWDDRVILAEVVRIVFEGKIFWKEIIALIVQLYQMKDFSGAILLLNKVIQPMEGPTIHQLWESLRNISLAGLVNPQNTVKFLAVDIFFEIYKLEQDIEILVPVFNLFFNMLENYKTLNKNDFTTIWQKYIKDILKLKDLDGDTIIEFLTAASIQVQDETIECSLRITVISSLINVIPKMNKEIIEQFTSASIELGVQYITEHADEQQQLSDVLDFIEGALQTRLELSVPTVKESFDELVQSEEGAAQTLSIYIIGLLLQYAPNEIAGDLEAMQMTLKQALQSEEELLVTAALSSIERLDDTCTQAASISRGLMGDVLQFLTSESPEIRLLSYHAMQSLCLLCDSPVDGLFATVWGVHMQGLLTEEDTDNYLSLLSLVIELSNDFSDEFVESILQFSIELLTDKPETTKAAALSIISVLTEHDETIPSRIPDIGEVINTLLQYENDDVIVQALGFIRNTAYALREASLEIISPFFEIIDGYLQKNTKTSTPKTLSKALSTSAVIIKYTHDKTLLDSVCQILKSFFEEPEVEVLKDACESLNLIARELRPVEQQEAGDQNEVNGQRSHYFFEKVIQTIDEEIDVDLLGYAFDAARHIYKYSKNFEPEYYTEQCEGLIQRIVDGEINYCAGTAPQEMEFQSELVKSIMYLFYQFIISQEELPEQLLQFSLEWMTSRQEAIDPILGTLSDIISIKQIPDELIAQIIEFAKGNVETSDPLLQLSMTTFITRVGRYYPQFMQSVTDFVTTIDNWWGNDENRDGFAETISNFASFYLLVDVNEERNAKALKLFPPADVTESKFMAETLLHFAQAKERSPDILLAITLGVADLLTEPVSIAQKRKIPVELREDLKELMQSLIQQDQSRWQEILEHFSSSQKKRDEIVAILGMQ